ncbi:MAG: ABC transporter ATP-binding protein [Spirochaetales bacterium]
MIEVESVSKSFGSLRAVEEVSFAVRPGSVLGLLGPNGAGKTTILRMIVGVLTPDSGSVRINGHDLDHERIDAQIRIGYLPENAPLYSSNTTIEHLRFAARVHGLFGRAAKIAVERVAEVCGVEAVGHRLVGQLSRGYRQRVGLAAALVHDPPVLVLDEPTTGLDPNQIEEFRGIVRRAAKTKAIVFSTHILQEVEAICDEILVVNHGVEAAYGTPAKIHEALSAGESVRVTVAHAPGDEARRALDELGTSTITQSDSGDYAIRVQLRPRRSSRDVYAWAVQFGLPLSSLEQERDSLETLFAKLTRDNERGGDA